MPRVRTNYSCHPKLRIMSAPPPTLLSPNFITYWGINLSASERDGTLTTIFSTTVFSNSYIAYPSGSTASFLLKFWLGLTGPLPQMALFRRLCLELSGLGAGSVDQPGLYGFEVQYPGLIREDRCSLATVLNIRSKERTTVSAARLEVDLDSGAINQNLGKEKG